MDRVLKFAFINNDENNIVVGTFGLKNGPTLVFTCSMLCVYTRDI